MQLGRVEGHARATVKHASLAGWTLLVVQPLGASGQPDGDVLLAVDGHGARAGDLVVLSGDGKGARELVGAPNSPVRWFVLGIRDA